MRIYLESLGCRLNYAEMATLGRQLAGAGHELTDAAAAADLCVLNSCTVTGEAARQSRQLARQLARANPAARLIVTGCYATLEGETVAQLPNVELVVGNERKDELLRLIQESGVRSQESGQESGDRSQRISEPADAASTNGQPQYATHALRTTQHRSILSHPRLRQNPGRLPQSLHLLHRDRGARGRAQPDDRRGRGRGERAARRGLPGGRADRRASGRLRERSRRGSARAGGRAAGGDAHPAAAAVVAGAVRSGAQLLRSVGGQRWPADAAPAPAGPVGQRRGAAADGAAQPRRGLRGAGRGRARRDPRPDRHHRPDRGLPGRDRGRFRARRWTLPAGSALPTSTPSPTRRARGPQRRASAARCPRSSANAGCAP